MAAGAGEGRTGEELLNEHRAFCGVWELERQRLHMH